ncbi:MAG: 3-deoxy-manno-octulosonate cytidylyltransferase [Desulfomonile sp.]|nr:3-deoxy-manno-octulosonate cytidylyltransferase [Desulfomonile sp.]
MTLECAGTDFDAVPGRMGRPRIVGFIPARAESTRFPGKPLADILGKPMIMWVYHRSLRSPTLSEAYVATDSQEISDAVCRCGGKAILTSSTHSTGTDRVAEAARAVGLKGSDIAVNIQGDQPLMDPSMVDEVVTPLLDDPAIPMSTLIYRIVRDEEINHPNAVKTVFDREGFALYFSRATIPYYRDDQSSMNYYKHHGIYAYRNDFLQHFATLPHGALEVSERLEQLRALEHGFRIKVVLTEKDSIEVDTPADLQRVRDEASEMD